MVAGSLAAALPCGADRAWAADPFASNNGLYPAPGAQPPPFAGPHPFRALSRNYPTREPTSSWHDAKPHGPMSQQTARDYMMRLKAYVAPTLRGMIETPAGWDPAASGWYDMPWMADLGKDATTGRESILGSFSGQVILQHTFAHGQLTADTQNHTVVYYDPTAAFTLGRVWADIHAPAKEAAQYRDGALVVKAGGVAATADEWPAVAGAAEWRVYRPPVAEVLAARNGQKSPLVPVVTPLRVMQFDIIVKDGEAAPGTGWVFTTFVFDKDAPKGSGPWDQLVPLGATWGNDPRYDDVFLGHAPFDAAHPEAPRLDQTWLNPDAPAYALDTMGWGGRLSGPIDIAERHGLILTEGVELGTLKTDAACGDPDVEHVSPSGPFRASGCLSCHGTAQSGTAARMYPSPIAAGLPLDGQPFCLYRPGSARWADWFQNRPGSRPQRPTEVQAAATGGMPGFVRYAPDWTSRIAPEALRAAAAEPVHALDYDMLLMFAVSNAETATRGFSLSQERVPVH